MSHDDVPDHPAILTPEQAAISRRSALRRLGGAGLGLAALGGGLGGALLGTAGDATDEAYAAGCVLTPELTEGPYYLDLRKIRRNITEGKSGLRLDLRIRSQRLDSFDERQGRPLRAVLAAPRHAPAQRRRQHLPPGRQRPDRQAQQARIVAAQRLHGHDHDRDRPLLTHARSRGDAG